MKPVKSQFLTFVQFTTNIEDRILNFHIDDAFFYVIRGKLGYPPDPNKDLGLEILNFTVGSDDSPELVAFFDNYVLRWWILIAFKRFLENHGRNVTQYGYTQTADPEGTFTQVDSAGRATYLRRLQDDINVAETNVFLHLHNVQWTFDGFQYLHQSFYSRHQKKSFGISPIGKPHRRSLYGRWGRFGNMYSEPNLE